MTFVLGGSTHPALAEAVATSAKLPLCARSIERFPDGELHVALEQDVSGHEVALVQCASHPVGESVLELLLLADACRRSGASRLIGLVPYLGYARQDRRVASGEALGSKVMARMLELTGMARLVVVEFHQPALEGSFDVPLCNLSAAELLADEVKPWLDRDAVVVAPDAGAAKLAERCSNRLGAGWAMVHKVRQSGTSVSTRGVIGELRGRRAVIVDDMITTGGTIEAAVRAVEIAGAAPGAIVAAAHAVFTEGAADRVGRLGLRGLVVTDTLPRALQLAFPFRFAVTSVAPSLARVLLDDCPR